MKKLTPTQRAILTNVAAGRPYDRGRAIGMASAGGWVSSYHSCRVHDWIDADGKITATGREALA